MIGFQAKYPGTKMLSRPVEKRFTAILQSFLPQINLLLAREVGCTSSNCFVPLSPETVAGECVGMAISALLSFA
jgi:hypothetical protein